MKFFKAVSKYFEIFWKYWKISKTFWIISKNFKKASKNFKKVLKNFAEKFWKSSFCTQPFYALSTNLKSLVYSEIFHRHLKYILTVCKISEGKYEFLKKYFFSANDDDRVSLSCWKQICCQFFLPWTRLTHLPPLAFWFIFPNLVFKHYIFRVNWDLFFKVRFRQAISISCLALSICQCLPF